MTMPWAAFTFLLTILIFCEFAEARAQDCETRPFIGERWLEAAPRGDARALEAFDSYAFPGTGDEEGRAGIRTDGVVVIEGGRLVYERYGRGFKAGQRHIAWSATKSFVHGLYGRAVSLGLVDIDDSAAHYIPGLDDGEKRKITLRHLLEMRSGLDFEETYEPLPITSSVVAMLYTIGHDDMARYTAMRDLAHAPGDVWSYKSGASVLLMAALKKIVGEEDYPDWPWRVLFDPLGMRSVVFERDGAGTFVGSSYLYATPRDLARFGQLYLDDGCWNGEHLLPEGWVAYAGTLSPPLRHEQNGGTGFGAHWWVRSEEGAPTDMLMALGHWGQSITVLPREGLVIVRTADDRDGTFSRRRFIELALEAFTPRRRSGS